MDPRRKDPQARQGHRRQRRLRAELRPSLSYNFKAMQDPFLHGLFLGRPGLKSPLVLEQAEEEGLAFFPRVLS